MTSFVSDAGHVHCWESVLPCLVLLLGPTFRTPGFLQGDRNCEHEVLTGSLPAWLSVGARELGRSLTEMTYWIMPPVMQRRNLHFVESVSSS